MNIPHDKELDYKMRVFCETGIICLAISRNGCKCSCFQARYVTHAGNNIKEHTVYSYTIKLWSMNAEALGMYLTGKTVFGV
jgi:hypothetical protein